MYCVASYVGFMSHIIWYRYDTSLVVIAILACRVLSYNSSLYFMASYWMLCGPHCALYDIILAYHCWSFVLKWLHIMWSRNVCIHCDIVWWHMAYYMDWILHLQSISLPTIWDNFQMMHYNTMRHANKCVDCITIWCAIMYPSWRPTICHNNII